MKELSRRKFLSSTLRDSLGAYGLMSLGLKPKAALKGVGAQAAPLESVCPKSSPPSKELYAMRITELDTVGRVEAYPN
jgi:hypothetical protein